MKPTVRFRLFLCIASSAQLGFSHAHADTRYWDGGTSNIGPPGNGVSGGTAGDWDNTLGENTTNWDPGNGLAHVAWGNANLDTAFFGGTAGTVTRTDPITVGGLGFFSNSGGTITYTTTTASSAKTFIETLGSVALTTGHLNLVNTLDKSAGSQTIALSGLTRTGATNTSAITFSNTGGLNVTNDRIRVNGIPTDPTAGEIIGAWATTGAGASAQTDYAVYDSDGTNGYVVAAGSSLTTTSEGSWASDSTAYQFGTAQTPTANRNAAALRYTAGANSLDLAGFTLKTNGILNGGSGLLTISGSGGTVLHAGSLVIGNVGNIGGASANLTFGGTATFAPSAALNFSGGTLTVNTGGYRTITGNGATAFATTTGAGTLRYTSDANTKSLNLGNASGFTGNLEHRLNGNAGYSKWILGGNNTYTGSTSVVAGILNIQHANALGATSGTTTVDGGATLQLQGGVSHAAETLSRRGDTSTDFVKSSDDTTLYSLTTTFNTGVTINVDRATVAGTSAKTMSIGTLGLNAAAAAATGVPVNR